MRNDLTRRATSLVSLALFLLGSNFCLVATGPAQAGVLKLAAASSGSAHRCCAAAAAKASRDTEATRQATAPCCVAVSPTVASHGASIDAAPLLAPVPAFAPAECFIVVPIPEAFAAPEEPDSPATRAATPDAGRAPPRL